MKGSFIQFADDTAKIEPKKASMQLYRYASPGAQVKPPRLSKLYDKLGSWEVKEARCKNKSAICCAPNVWYLQRLQCVRAPYKVPEPKRRLNLPVFVLSSLPIKRLLSRISTRI